MTGLQEHDNVPMSQRNATSMLSDFDLYLFGQGENYRIHEKMGAHLGSVSLAKG